MEVKAKSRIFSDDAQRGYPRFSRFSEMINTAEAHYRVHFSRGPLGGVPHIVKPVQKHLIEYIGLFNVRNVPGAGKLFETAVHEQ
jgi:hypothetical protein